MSNDNNDSKAQRARNKTVMLTPDIANQMRSRLMTGAHRSGSTEKLDTGLINQVRENFAANNAASVGRERDTVDKQTQIIDTSRFKNQLPLADEDHDQELEQNFLEALKNKATTKPAEKFTKPNDAFGGLDKLDFDEEEVAPVAAAPTPIIETPVEYEDISEDFMELEDLSVEFKTASPVVEEVEELETYNIDIPEFDNSTDNNIDNNIEEEFEMNQPTGSLTSDLKRSGNDTRKITLPATGGVVKNANGDYISWEKETPLVGFLVTFDGNPKGDFVVLRTGRLIISSEQADKGNALVINSESVSPMHAIIRISDNSIVVLDQLSETGTKIEKADGATIELSGDKANLEHGDLISFGERSYRVCVLF